MPPKGLFPSWQVYLQPVTHRQNHRERSPRGSGPLKALSSDCQRWRISQPVENPCTLQGTQDCRRLRLVRHGGAENGRHAGRSRPCRTAGSGGQNHSTRSPLRERAQSTRQPRTPETNRVKQRNRYAQAEVTRLEYQPVRQDEKGSTKRPGKQNPAHQLRRQSEATSDRQAQKTRSQSHDEIEKMSVELNHTFALKPAHTQKRVGNHQPPEAADRDREWLRASSTETFVEASPGPLAGKFPANSQRTLCERLLLRVGVSPGHTPNERFANTANASTNGLRTLRYGRGSAFFTPTMLYKWDYMRWRGTLPTGTKCPTGF